jgi:hypothetical protein
MSKNIKRIIIVVVVILAIALGYYLADKYLRVTDEDMLADIGLEVDETTIETEKDKDEPVVAAGFVGQYLPESCPPSGERPRTVTLDQQKNIVDTSLLCGDMNWYYNSHVIRNAKTDKDIVYYSLTGNFFEWHFQDGKKHKLESVPDFVADCEEFGFDNPGQVTDVMLDGQSLNVLSKPINYKDKCVGFLAGAKFELNDSYDGGKLTLPDGETLIIDFKDSKVTK